MGFRTFRDSRGATWQAWGVVPRNQHHRPRTGRDRRSPDPVIRYAGPERRSGADRRRLLSTLSPGLEGGWLAFESGSERRRLVPIPEGWDTCSDAELEELCRQARPVPRVKLI
jgi:hypothetical protein